MRIRHIIACLLLLLLLPGLLAASSAALPAVYAQTYYAELPAMVRRLDEAEGQRLILIGGSNIAFGVDTALLQNLLVEQGFDYTVCPMGLYGAVGTSAMLSLTEGSLRAGDLVILAVEPTSGTMSTYFGAEAFWKCAEKMPSLALRLNANQRGAAAGTWLQALQERVSIAQSGQLPRNTDAYALAAFDSTCNMVYERAGNTMALGWDTASPIDLAQVEIAADFAEQVNTFCQHAARRGASVWLSFCPMNAAALTDAARDAVLAFGAMCNAAFLCPLISNPEKYVMDSGWFYDSNFHLNSAGAAVRTITLAEDILAALGCPKATGHPLPDLPAAIARQADGTAGDASAFRFTPAGEEGYLVSGLTEEGLQQDTLTVPTAWQGRPVVGLTDGALAGADLTELRLPACIEYLPAGFSAGILRLERLVLEHRQKPCGLMDGALDGLEGLRIYVPAEAWPLYRDGYGCDVNPWAAYLNQLQTW